MDIYYNKSYSTMIFNLQSIARFTCRRRFVLVILLAAFSCTCTNAQQIVTLKASLAGITSTGTTKNMPLQASSTAQILADPIVKCVNGNCQIDSFQISIVIKANGKENPLFGPFAATGGRLPQLAINAISNYKNQSMNIFVEDIKASTNGKPMRLDPLYIKCEK